MNHLYFADCLDVLKELYAEHNGKGFIDLIYIDPPFNSKRNYNVLFESIDMKDATAQKQAFADTWSNYEYKDTIHLIAELDKDLFTFLETLDKLRTSDSSVAYLATMSIRIWYMHKLLKETGSFYLHCDSTMSHYLKIVCDLIFGEENFQNEIIWKRADAHNDKSLKSFGKITDMIFFYVKSSKFKWNRQTVEIESSTVDRDYRKDDNGRYFRLGDLAAPGGRGPIYEINGVKRAWKWTEKKFAETDKAGNIYYTKTGRPFYKIYLDEHSGIPLQNLWIDIPQLKGGPEKMDYPTQKPQALLERIIGASTSEGDLVADFFCGCGTTIAAAQKLNRQWLGSDISHLAIRLIVKRLVDTYGAGIRHTLDIKGFPRDIASAKELAEGRGGRFEFQDWVIEVLLNGIVNPKKTADGGWDGYITFDNHDSEKEFVVVEVKSGHINVKNLREFEQVVTKEKAGIGVFVCFEDQVTAPMQKLVKESGFYNEKLFGNRYPKIQIITVEDLLHHHKEPLMPKFEKTTFKSAARSKDESKTSKGLFD
jgi:adenine specific DNA methylase Mod